MSMVMYVIINYTLKTKKKHDYFSLNNTGQYDDT